MCTALAYRCGGFYFGRTLDYDIDFGQQVVVTPRNYTLELRHAEALTSHLAVIGMGCVRDSFPLYFDAVNEAGLCMAGLNFVGNAVYRRPCAECISIAQFELIPWLLGKCDSVDGALLLLKDACITGTAFSAELPPASLHWLLADSRRTVVIEAVADGLRVYDDPPCVLTNNPPFPEQLENLEKYAHLTPDSPKGDSRGLGAVGLPGDLSSQSRFVRAAFMARHSLYDNGLSQFFHILGTVAQPRGCCRVGDGLEYTQYTACADAAKGVYYYSTYADRTVYAVDMHRENLNSTNLVCYAPSNDMQIIIRN